MPTLVDDPTLKAVETLRKAQHEKAAAEAALVTAKKRLADAEKVLDAAEEGARVALGLPEPERY